MTTVYYLKQDGEHEIEVKGSRFICAMKHVESETEALAFLNAQKKLHRKANHHCSAYTIQSEQLIQRAHDDGEPSGTAGVPMLDVLKHMHLQNTIAVVTRYFGGTKLGAGGLIRAYSTAVSETVKSLGRISKMPQTIWYLTLPYALYDKVLYRLNEQAHIHLIDTAFLTDVTITCGVDGAFALPFHAWLTEQFNTQISARAGEIQYVSVDVDDAP